MSHSEGYSHICKDNTFGPTVPGLADCRGGFDFTVTFEESILSLAPSCLIVAIIPWRIYSLWARSAKTRDCCLLSIKLFGFVALDALHAVLLAFLCRSQASHRVLLVLSGTFQLLASVCLTALCYWEHRKAIRPSFILSASLLLTTLLDAVRARTQSLLPDSNTVVGVLVAIVVVKLLLLLADARDKASILLPEYSKSSLELRSSLFSRAFFIWLFPVLSMGFKTVMSSDDLPPINENLASQTLTAKVERRWKRRVSVGPLSLFIDVLASFPKELYIILLANLVQVGLNICQPLLIQELVTFLDSADRPINVGYGLLGGFFCVSMTNALVIPWGFHYVGRLMTMTRGALVPLIYSKLLQLRGNDLHQMTAFTLMSADVETIVNDSWRLLEPCAHLLQIVIGTYLLYRQLGAVCCIPIVVILLTFTLVAVIGSRIAGHQSAWFDQIEKRIDLTTHTLSFLHSVKLLGLSRILEDKLHKKRKNELRISQMFRIINCSALASASAPQVLAPLVTFGAYSIAKMVSGQPNFSEATAVTSFSILNLISAPAMQLLLAIPMGAQAIGCYGRIQSFLRTPEDLIPSTATTSSSDLTGQSARQDILVEPESSIALEYIEQSRGKLEVRSDQNSRLPIQFMPNSIIAITGPSGCGKSTLLRKLLASQQIHPSDLFPSGNIAYCSQTPWIFEGTIRDNILGQSEVDESWYQSVLHSCELREDLDNMPNRDSTEVGSGGSKLSGGQKQRIAIARALCSRKARVIFDDVTSALDGRTTSSLITNLFSKDGIVHSRNMSVVVATHSSQILCLADQVLLMGQDGQVIDSGPYAELATRQEYFSQHQSGKSSQPSSLPRDPVVQVKELEASRGEYASQLKTKVDDLRRKQGDWRPFTYYLGAMGWLGVGTFVTGISLYMVLNAIFGVWLVWWAEDSHGSRGLGYWLGLYATWATLITIGMLITPIFFFTKLAYKASHVMHADLLTTTMRAPLTALTSIEDTASLINRFSQDIRLCDWQLPFNILLTVMALLACLASIGVAISAVPYLAIGAPGIAIVLYLLQMLYLRTSRQLRLLELEQKAPIVSLFLDSIQGITTIHSFGWSSAYVQKIYNLLDSCQKPLYTLYCVQRWLILVLSLIATGTELIVIGAAIALRTKVSAGLVGLAVVHVTTLAKSLCDLVMQWTDMETSLGAVSRIYTFTRETPCEVQSDEASSNLSEGWPLTGSITFENVSATYEDTTTRLEVSPKLALDSITFNIKPGEKLGVCGRTGSGKSSLMAALLQIIPCYQGRVLIDGTDLSTLHCEDVRSKLNYVTQEPFLFDGTMRENLNPWHVPLADQEMTAALEKVTLWKRVISLGGLDALLSRDSFSHGERQLFCLARSLLRSSSIVILDEPTGHIDPTTDATIQQVIRDGFPGRTIIMIAHRLRTLLDFDTAIVLDHGRVKEIGPPKRLLSEKTSTFNALYYATEGSAADEE